ncbi:MAG: hypothetical protein ACI4L5_04300 [Negativibacillus sp.]
MRKRTWRSTLFCLSMALCLYLSFYLCRYTLLDLHFMKQWPEIMAIFGAVLMAGSVLINAPFTCVGIGPGYLLSFFVGYLCQWDYYGAHGERYNTLWQIWTVVWLLLILLGFIADCFNSKRLHRRSSR